MIGKFNLTPMLKPKSVAIIGASRNPEKVGNIILQNYVSAGYSGKLYPVNPNADEILGLKCYKTMQEIGEAVDLAVIAVPAPMVPMALDECGKSKARSVIVISGGFSEIGETALQEQIKSMANKYNIPMLGPNCLGVVDTRSRTDTMFLPSFKITRPQVGFVSFVSQSGAVGSTVLDIIGGEGCGLSKFISYGNAAQLDEVDILEYLMNDDETKVIILYIEGIRRGKEFVELARKITKKKPVIVLKAGRTSAGQAAAISHTASLAGNYATQEAIFKQFGFTIAKDLSELVYYAKIFSSEIEANGNRVAVITNGGGTGVITADAIGSSEILKMAEYSNQTKKVLRKAMPPLVNITNPLDLAGDADSKRYSDALNAVCSDPNVDMIIAIVLFQTPGADSTVTACVVHQKETVPKPIIAMSMGANYTQGQKVQMEAGGVPTYDSPAEAIASLEALFKYSEFKKKIKG